jgi:hypothetical protein
VKAGNTHAAVCIVYTVIFRKSLKKKLFRRRRYIWEDLGDVRYEIVNWIELA